MSRWVRASFVAVGIWLSAAPGAAGVLELDFALDEGRVAFGIASPLVAGITTEFTGSATLVLTGVDARGMLTAPLAGATFRSLSLQVPLTIGVQPPPMSPTQELVGTANFTLLRPAQGGFDGATLRLLENAFEVQAMGTFMCRGSACTSSTSFVNFILGNASPAVFQLSSLDGPDGGSLNIGILLGSTVLARLDLVGREVNRRFSAPEPPDVGMLAVGGIALVGLALRRRRVGRAHRAVTGA